MSIKLAACRQRIRELEQTGAEQQAVIAQQQEAIAVYQEQLAKAAEQLRFFKRAMFGQRRERYNTLARPEVAVRARNR